MLLSPISLVNFVCIFLLKSELLALSVSAKAEFCFSEHLSGTEASGYYWILDTATTNAESTIFK